MNDKEGSEDVDGQNDIKAMLKAISDKVDLKCDKLQNTISDLKQEVNEISSSQQYISDRFDRFEKSVSEVNTVCVKGWLDTENVALKKTVSFLENERSNLKLKQDDLDQYERRDCLVFTGVPLTQNEDTSNIVEKIAHYAGVQVARHNINISHRLRIRNDGKPPSIIAKFTHREIRDNLYTAWKNSVTADKLGFSATNRIFINESLTPQRRELYRICLDFKKTHNYKFLWTCNGNILLRKTDSSEVVSVNSRADLDKLN